jgi:GNAT superfamily N-acetyltransferase
MARIAPESFLAILPELMPLFRLHWRDLGLYQDKMPLAPRVAVYEYLEKNGELLTLTARLEGELLGYFIARIGPALHYETTIHAQTDITFVHPKMRGRGLGVRLFLAAEKEMKARQVGIWQAGTKTIGPHYESMDRLLRWMKFAPTDLYYSKWLGD